MFQGFSGNTVDFLWGIRFNNEKPWFEAHKEDYLTHLYRPMKELGQEVFQAIHTDFPHSGLHLKISRIYRDARRLHGRGPYKESLWLALERPNDMWSDDPVFWFEFSPESYSYGLGFSCAKPVSMAKFRARLDANPAPFQALATQFQGQDRFQFESTPYKRPKGDPNDPLHPWYNSKGFSLYTSRPHDPLVFSADLVGELVAGFTDLMPIYNYLITLPGDPDPRYE